MYLDSIYIQTLTMSCTCTMCVVYTQPIGKNHLHCHYNRHINMCIYTCTLIKVSLFRDTIRNQSNHVLWCTCKLYSMYLRIHVCTCITLVNTCICTTLHVSVYYFLSITQSAGVLVRSNHTGEVVSQSSQDNNSLLRTRSIATASASITPTSPSECVMWLSVTIIGIMWWFRL